MYIHTELHSSLIRKLDFAERYFEVLHSTYMRLRMQNSKLYVVKLNEQNRVGPGSSHLWYICKDTKDKVKP